MRRLAMPCHVVCDCNRTRRGSRWRRWRSLPRICRDAHTPPVAGWRCGIRRPAKSTSAGSAVLVGQQIPPLPDPLPPGERGQKVQTGTTLYILNRLNREHGLHIRPGTWFTHWRCGETNPRRPNHLTAPNSWLRNKSPAPEPSPGSETFSRFRTPASGTFSRPRIPPPAPKPSPSVGEGRERGRPLADLTRRNPPRGRPTRHRPPVGATHASPLRPAFTHHPS